mmetsp:Transcript_81855/g.226854  ORF Transcript_81855/g.226854 Transcript_81855/m.226854 type:complete len:250 (+) Transcript_81855:1266-2015(+)
MTCSWKVSAASPSNESPILSCTIAPTIPNTSAADQSWCEKWSAALAGMAVEALSSGLFRSVSTSLRSASCNALLCGDSMQARLNASKRQSSRSISLRSVPACPVRRTAAARTPAVSTPGRQTLQPPSASSSSRRCAGLAVAQPPERLSATTAGTAAEARRTPNVCKAPRTASALLASVDGTSALLNTRTISPWSSAKRCTASQAGVPTASALPAERRRFSSASNSHASVPSVPEQSARLSLDRPASKAS